MFKGTLALCFIRFHHEVATFEGEMQFPVAYGQHLHFFSEGHVKVANRLGLELQLTLDSHMTLLRSVESSSHVLFFTSFFEHDLNTDDELYPCWFHNLILSWNFVALSGPFFTFYFGLNRKSAENTILINYRLVVLFACSGWALLAAARYISANVSQSTQIQEDVRLGNDILATSLGKARRIWFLDMMVLTCLLAPYKNPQRGGM